MVVRLLTDEPAIIDHYGAGLSSQAFGREPEAVVTVTYEEITGEYDDGTP